ncbi:hypothetical protein W822_01060 [Advenella kashmirensis W13003]|uniref:Uncharacterized protein n=1 Tax=Advenella kashmirensis W13003 TaxID=1424334 RepID=V8QYC8_9BURK|nr:hypothetical protein W822_01060 [Advenella kashmirensis W13003]
MKIFFMSNKIASQHRWFNAIAKGPIWIPLIPASFLAGKAAELKKNKPMSRPGQAFELVPAYASLVSGFDLYDWADDRRQWGHDRKWLFFLRE